MTDGVIKSTGNSRYLKSVANLLSLAPTWPDAVELLVAGNFPVDFNGINPNGWNTQGTPLNKANLLSDATGTLLGLGSTGTVNAALAALKTSLNELPSGTKNAMIDTGSVTPSNLKFSITLSGKPRAAVFCSITRTSNNSTSDSIYMILFSGSKASGFSSGYGSFHEYTWTPSISGKVLTLTTDAYSPSTLIYFAISTKS